MLTITEHVKYLQKRISYKLCWSILDEAAKSERFSKEKEMFKRNVNLMTEGCVES